MDSTTNCVMKRVRKDVLTKDYSHMWGVAHMQTPTHAAPGLTPATAYMAIWLPLAHHNQQNSQQLELRDDEDAGLPAERTCKANKAVSLSPNARWHL